MSLWQLLQAALLFTNAFAILNEDRFLKRCEQLKTGTPHTAKPAAPQADRPPAGSPASFLSLLRLSNFPLTFSADGITLASSSADNFYGGPTPNASVKAQVGPLPSRLSLAAKSDLRFSTGRRVPACVLLPEGSPDLSQHAGHTCEDALRLKTDKRGKRFCVCLNSIV